MQFLACFLRAGFDGFSSLFDAKICLIPALLLPYFLPYFDMFRG